jgi:cephalosporin-C deacetylase-like acetyl esterase
MAVNFIGRGPLSSRRQFFQAGISGLAVPLKLGLAAFAGRENTSTNPPGPTWARDYWNDWPAYLSTLVNAARTRRRTELGAVHSAAQVAHRIEEVQQKVWKLVGGPLEKTPLNARTVGTIERSRYRIEKVIFESQPQVYVAAHLYLPSAAISRCPAILSPLGHYREGKLARNYMHLFQNLARKGYVVFAFDPFGQGERAQFLDSSGHQSRLEDPDAEHDRAGNPVVLLGDTFALYRAWDGIRAMDYLSTRPEVDAARIGCMGHSGGATMTMFLCTLEPRIQVAVEVEGHTRNFGGPSFVPPGAMSDSEQNLVGSMPEGVDRGDLVWAFAPKPLLMIYTPQDAFERPKYIAACEEIYEEVRAAYRLMGAEDRVRLSTSFLPHNYDFFNRRQTYAWFNRWLAEKDSGEDEAPFEAIAPELLNCTTTGQVLSSLGGRSVIQVRRDRLQAVGALSPFQTSREEWIAVRERVRQGVVQLLALPSSRSPLDARKISSGALPEIAIEEIEFRSEPEIRIPGWFVRPERSSARFPVLVYLTENGKDAVVDELSGMHDVIRRGYALCAIDMRGFGPTAPRFPAEGPRWFYQGAGAALLESYGWAGLILGKPVLGQRVWDFLRCLDYLETRPDVNASNIRVAGVGGGGLVALFGSAVDQRVRSVLCCRMLADYRSLLDAADYSMEVWWLVSGILRKFDLPDLVAALAPRPCSLVNLVGAAGQILPDSAAFDRCRTAMQVYSQMSASDYLLLRTEPERPMSKVLLDWL